jgi:hypothetical protein
MKKACEIWKELLQKPSTALRDLERNAKRVHVLLCDFESGSWLYNISPATGQGQQWSELRETANSVAAIGDSSVARLLHEIADIVEKADVQKPGTWDQFLSAADPSKRINELERLISDELDKVRLKLEEFSLQNLACDRE